MKILRYYWSPGLQRDVNDLVLTVTRETKTLLIAVNRHNPTCVFRFRKPEKFVALEGARVYPVPRTVKSWSYHYRIVEADK